MGYQEEKERRGNRGPVFWACLICRCVLRGQVRPFIHLLLIEFLLIAEDPGVSAKTGVPSFRELTFWLVVASHRPLDE